jgi:dipeptidyl aminopeptidase/acylaminoacyl peptidase
LCCWSDHFVYCSLSPNATYQTLMMRFALQIVLTIVVTVPFAACGGDRGPSAPVQELAVVGRLERGSTVRLVAHGGTAADSLVANVALSPAAAGTIAGTSVKLLQAGPLSVTATAPDGRTIAAVLDVKAPPTLFFDGAAAGNRDVYSVSLDGGDIKRWTTSAGEETHPSVAAGLLVFSSTRDGNGELYSIPTAAGGVEKRLTTSAANETQPSLSATGASVAYASDASGLPRLFVAPVSLSAPARLTAPSFGFGGSIESDATWSAAGDRIAFMSTANGRANLFVTSSTAGSTPAAVSGSDAQVTDLEPAWSPDGNRIAFASTRVGGTQIFLLDVRTGAITQVTSGALSSGQPGWLPDGRMVFTLFANGESTLWWTDLEAGGPPVEVPTGTRSPGHPTGARP